MTSSAGWRRDGGIRRATRSRSYAAAMTRGLSKVTLLTTAVVLLTAAPALANGPNDPPDRCFATNADGDMATCTWENGHWVRTFDGGGLGMGDSGSPSGFVALFVIFVLIGIGVTMWRVSVARQMASESGMDPDRAGLMTLMSPDGLDATYLASSLRERPGADSAPAPEPSPPPAPEATRTATERLAELQQLRDAGTITLQEYDERRKAIIDSI